MEAPENNPPTQSFVNSGRRRSKYSTNIKIILLGIITLTVPATFILQDIQLEKEKKENVDTQSRVKELETKLDYNEKIIQLMTIKSINRDTIYKTIYDTIDIRKIVWGEGKKEIVYIVASLKNNNELEFVEYFKVPIDYSLQRRLYNYKKNYLDKHSILDASKLTINLPVDNPISKLLAD